MSNKPSHPSRIRRDLLHPLNPRLSRRELLSLMAKGALALPLAGTGLSAAITPAQQQSQALTREQQLSQGMPPEARLTEDELLEEIVSRALLYFWAEAGRRGHVAAAARAR